MVGITFTAPRTGQLFLGGIVHTNRSRWRCVFKVILQRKIKLNYVLMTLTSYCFRLRNFRDMNGLAFIVGSEFSKLVENRKKAVQAVCGIPDKPSEADILEGSNCSRCRDYFMKSGPVCKHCKIKDVITAYEKVLFSSRKSHKNMIRNTSEATSKFKSAKKSKRNSQKAEASSPASQNGNFFSCKNGDSNYGSGSENDEFALREVEVDRVDGW